MTQSPGPGEQANSEGAEVPGPSGWTACSSIFCQQGVVVVISLSLRVPGRWGPCPGLGWGWVDPSGFLNTQDPRAFPGGVRGVPQPGHPCTLQQSTQQTREQGGHVPWVWEGYSQCLRATSRPWGNQAG